MDDEASRPSPQGRKVADRVARRREAALSGHTGDEAIARRHLVDADAGVRATALGALVRLGVLEWDDVTAARNDEDAGVRRRLAELLPAALDAGVPGADDPTTVLGLLRDPDDTVADAAAWAAGELWQAPDTDDDDVPGDGDAGGRDGDPGDEPTTCPIEIVEELSHLVRDHDDSLVREAAAAALGSIGDERGLPAILHACGDKATVRRRAVLALAPFGGPDVDAALERAAKDRDWQVRQAAEDLLL